MRFVLYVMVKIQTIGFLVVRGSCSFNMSELSVSQSKTLEMAFFANITGKQYTGVFESPPIPICTQWL